jgi:hypothetical protein
MVTDRDNDLAKVEFYDDETKLAEKATAPFSTTLAGLTMGTHALKVSPRTRPARRAGPW